MTLQRMNLLLGVCEQNLKPDCVMGYSLSIQPYIVMEKLKSLDMTIAFAESCTSGLLPAYLTEIPGASNHVLGGIVAYTVEMKRKMLGIECQPWNVVSEVVAQAMAEQARIRMGADIGVGTTGWLDGEEKRCAYVAVNIGKLKPDCINEGLDESYVRHIQFDQDQEHRVSNRLKTVEVALDLIFERLCFINANKERLCILCEEKLCSPNSLENFCNDPCIPY